MREYIKRHKMLLEYGFLLRNAYLKHFSKTLGKLMLLIKLRVYLVFAILIPLPEKKHVNDYYLQFVRFNKFDVHTCIYD